LNLPNYLTLVRILLIPFFFSFLIYYGPRHPTFRLWALVVFLVAAATDALDGILARRFHWKTRLGTFLDPFADKLLLLCGFLGIASSQAFLLKPPVWAIVIIVFRDLLIIAGLMIIFFTTGKVAVKPNFLGKATTFFQMLTIGVILIEWNYSFLVWNLTIAFTISSAFVYTLRGIRQLNGKSKA